MREGRMVAASMIGFSSLMAAGLSSAVLLSAGPASAGVTLKGCMKWWHAGMGAINASKGWYNAKNMEVEVEWDGAGKDKTTFTDSEGCYKSTVRNAIFPYEGHNMNAQPYAKRKFKSAGGEFVRVYENVTDLFPTYFETPVKNVKNNKTGVIDISLGGNNPSPIKKGNLAFADKKYYYWNIATADIIGRYYDWAFDKGFKQLRGVDVIAPAVAPGNSYFNILTNNINLVSSTNPGSTPDKFANWVFTLLHEGTHALHAHVSPKLSDYAPGIIRPSRHSVYEITSPKIGWTEGFAAFLPVYYLADRGILGAYGNRSYTDVSSGAVVSKVPATSFVENHMNAGGQLQTNIRGAAWGDTSWFNDPNSSERGGSEGFVMGFLWDLVDSSKNTAAHSEYSNLMKSGLKLNSELSACQVENTVRRSYRGLSATNLLSSDPLLSYSTDCLAEPLSSIADVLKVRMRDNVMTFGEAYIQGKTEAVKYEVLKAYVTNGMRGAIPSGLKAYQNWTLSRSTAPAAATTTGWGDEGKPPAGTPAQVIQAQPKVNIRLPLIAQNALKVQWKSSRCMIANDTKQVRCYTNVDKNNGQKHVNVNIARADFCNGASGPLVGQSLKSPTFVAIDDGVNPAAIPVDICNVPIKIQY